MIKGLHIQVCDVVARSIAMEGKCYIVLHAVCSARRYAFFATFCRFESSRTF